MSGIKGAGGGKRKNKRGRVTGKRKYRYPSQWAFADHFKIVSLEIQHLCICFIFYILIREGIRFV